jgi:hypothetical protein
MAKSLLHTAPSLLLKVQRPGESERLIGYATSLQFTVFQGQKVIPVVDSPIPVQIAQAAGASMVRGQMMIYLPKGMTPETAGLVAYRQDQRGNVFAGNSKYLSVRLYDRLTGQLVFSCDYCKFSDYTVSVRARSVVQCALNFEGLFLNPGNPG